MNLINIIKLADGHLLTPNIDVNLEISGAYGGDLMSDVLACQPAECSFTDRTDQSPGSADSADG